MDCQPPPPPRPSGRLYLWSEDGTTLEAATRLLVGQGYDISPVPRPASPPVAGESLTVPHQIPDPQAARLQQLDQAFHDLIYAVSHDLRAPVRHIQGFTRALQQRLLTEGDPQDAKVVHYLEVIQASGQNLGALIEGLLTLSRISCQEMGWEPLPLGPMVERAIAQVRSTWDASGLEFAVGPLPQVTGDRQLLFQALVQLLDNAVKFTLAAGGNPSERGERQTPLRIEIIAWDPCTLLVRDPGMGFDQSQSRRLLAPLQRLHGRSDLPGLGLGLAIVQQIAYRHGGEVWAQSQPGQGASFYLRLGPGDRRPGL